PAGLVYLGDGAWGRGPRRPAARPYLARSAARLHVIRVRLDAQQRTFTAVDAQGRVIDRYVEPVRD
ncbi:MAG: hypothetical protein ACODAQ_05575, partial [Phycisphaeraceae bacterium]